MKDTGRFFFLVGVMLFCISLFYFDDLTGVILWRVGMALAVLGIGLFLMWGKMETVWSEKVKRTTRPRVILLFVVLSLIQSLIVMATLSMFFAVDGGTQFIVLLVSVPLMLMIAALWQFFGRFWHPLWQDQVVPFLYVGLFAVPGVKLSSGLVLFAKISGVLLVVFCLYALYRNIIYFKASVGET